MTTLTFPAPAVVPAGEIVATNVSEKEYLAQYAEHFCEWVRGVVIQMTAVSLEHDRLADYLRDVLKTYLTFNPIGRIVGAPFVMRFEESFREPDLQVILNDNPGRLTATAMIGPADLCIEVVSEESSARDYGDKFAEYEKAGVREYWIIDPLRGEARFHRLQDSKRYALIQPDDGGHYGTPLLPRLALHVPSLWQDPLPNIVETVEAVRKMLAEET
jgi:Uma2 family endonuclease